MAEVYGFQSYKDYLVARLDQMDGRGRGARTRLAAAMSCQTSYVAQVLRGSGHFSLEQGEAINDFLGHGEEEGNFFLLLLQRERAGAVKLRERFDRQIKKLLLARQDLKERLGVKQALSERDQVTYYSSWYYGAIHALASVPGFQNVDALARHLELEPKRVGDAVNFLLRSGILKRGTSGALGVGQARIHLSAGSPLIARHHANWRLQAIRTLERRTSHEDLHYSSVVSVSEKDTARVRELLVKTIEAAKPIIRDSAEERVQCFSIDFFRV